MTNNRRYFAGIGSRSTPEKVGKEMKLLCSELEELGYWLRSGGAAGADYFCQKGMKKNAQIWLPREDFNKDFQLCHPQHEYMIGGEDDKEAQESVDKFHKFPHKLTETSRKFMARNYRQIRGLNEPDSEFVIYWTPNGTWQGGTRQALAIAQHYQIPIFGMYDLTRQEILKQIEKIRLFSD